MLIGFCGKAGSGKDTASLFFKKYDSEFMSFAGPIKESAKILFNLTDEQLSDRVLKETIIPTWGLSPRQILQRLGTTLRTEFDDNLFVNNLLI